MNCDEYLPLISGHLDGVNSEIEERRLQEHLKTCEACRALLSQIEQNDALLKGCVVAPPSDLSARVMSEVRSTKQPSRKKRWIPIAASGFAAAALLSLVFLGALPLIGGAGSKDSADMKDKNEYDALTAAQPATAGNDLFLGDYEMEAPADTENIAKYDIVPALPEYGAFPAETTRGTTVKRNSTRYTPSAPMLIVWDADNVDALMMFEPENLNEYAPLTAKVAPSLYARYQAAIPLIRDFDLIAPDDGFDITVYTVPYKTLMAAIDECVGVYESAVYYPAAFTTPDECSIVLIDILE